VRKEKETKNQSSDQQYILSVLTLLTNLLFLALTFFIFFFQHLLSEALSEVAAKASTNCGPAFVMSFPAMLREWKEGLLQFQVVKWLVENGNI